MHEWDLSAGGHRTVFDPLVLDYCSQEDLEKFYEPRGLISSLVNETWDNWLCIKDLEKIDFRAGW